MQKQESRQELLWDEDPRWGNALCVFLAKLLAMGFTLSFVADLYSGNLDSLKYFFHALAILTVLGIGWMLVASFFYVSLRSLFWLKDAMQRGRR